MAKGRKKISAALVSKKGVPPFLRRPFHSHSEGETREWARALGRKLRAGSCVALTGPIGSGKTLFAKGLSEGLGVKHAREVKSPTFVLLHLYEGRVPIYHFDFYRLENEKDLDTIGFNEFVRDPRAISMVEWADRAPGRIPGDALWIQFKILSPTSRSIKGSGTGSGTGQARVRHHA